MPPSCRKLMGVSSVWQLRQRTGCWPGTEDCVGTPTGTGTGSRYAGGSDTAAVASWAAGGATVATAVALVATGY